MEPDFEDLSLLFPNLAAQLRNTLSTMHLAASQLASSRQREQDPALVKYFSEKYGMICL